MPPMRIPVCFDERIIIHDHIPIDTIRALSLPFPIFVYCMFCSLRLFIHRPSIHSSPYLSSLFIFSPRKRAPCCSHLLELQVFLRFPIYPLPFPTIPSTALRSEYPFKFQKWNFQQYRLFFVISNHYYMLIIHDLPK